MAAPEENNLFPPNPYYIPGYQGFVPQYNYQCGETFGKTTYRLLTDPGVGKSPRSLLAPLPKQKFVEDFSGTKHGVQDYLPGHPGHFPYEKAGAATNFPESVLGPKPPPAGPRGVTLPGLAETMDVEQDNRLPKLEVPNAIQQKVIPGYSGFIPRLTWISGVSYVQGMNEFDQYQFLPRNPPCSFGKRFPQTYWPNNRICTSAGLIPSYTGFVPHLRYTYALTFGNSTRKSYQKEQRRQACAL
ncbi:ciliary microtubule inner protein 2A [Cariama cristata]